jgi:opacity protein-like surface antigen
MKPTKLCLMALAACLASLSAQAKDWKSVRIGTDATYPPFESVDSNGQIVGFEVEYGYARTSSKPNERLANIACSTGRLFSRPSRSHSLARLRRSSGVNR